MANPTTVGYILSFDGTVIVDIVGATTLRAITTAQNGAVANALLYTLPNGTRINYNGTADATTTPGRMSQSIICTSGGPALYGTLVAKLGHYGTTVLSPLSGADLSAASILVAVEDITPAKIARVNSMHIRITVEVVGDWT